MSHSSEERAALADALAAAGPNAATLCEGWTTHDLAAHLVTRERRPDAGPGIMLPLLAGWTERVRRGFLKRPYEELVQLVRTGPPITSWAALPNADAMLNLTEHFVHAEDVRRAQNGWKPRDLPADRQAALWRALVVRGRQFFRHSPVGVTLATPDGRTHLAIGRVPAVTLTGEPAELMLYAFGRKDRALVEITGPPEAVSAFRGTHLAV